MEEQTHLVEKDFFLLLYILYSFDINSEEGSHIVVTTLPLGFCDIHNHHCRFWSGNWNKKFSGVNERQSTNTHIYIHQYRRNFVPHPPLFSVSFRWPIVHARHARGVASFGGGFSTRRNRGGGLRLRTRRKLHKLFSNRARGNCQEIREHTVSLFQGLSLNEGGSVPRGWYFTQ